MEGGVPGGSCWSGQPTEEERMAWEDQRQQREKLSNRMGQYLLKGYRMLNLNCDHCGNILLRTRNGVDFCVNCTEIEEAAAPTKRAKNTAVETQALEEIPTSTASQLATDSLPSNEKGLLTQLDVVQKEDEETGRLVCHSLSCTGSTLTTSEPVCQTAVSSGSDTLKSVVATQKVLLSKLQWATNELASTSSVEHSTQLCQLIKACVDALQSIECLDTSMNPTTITL